MYSGRLHVVVNVGEVDFTQVAPPRRHGSLVKVLQGFQPVPEHPIGLFFSGGDSLHDVPVETLLGFKDVVFFVVKSELIVFI